MSLVGSIGQPLNGCRVWLMISQNTNNKGLAELPVSPCFYSGGDEGARTPGLGIANATLSQLSYIPTR